MKSCLSWDGHSVPAQCGLRSLAICLSVQLLAQGWLQNSVFLSVCPSWGRCWLQL